MATSAPFLSPGHDLASVAADGNRAIGCAQPTAHRPLLHLSVSPQFHSSVGVTPFCPQRRIANPILQVPQLASSELRMTAQPIDWVAAKVREQPKISRLIVALVHTVRAVPVSVGP